MRSGPARRPFASEAGKVAAFLRRDFLEAWSYRTAFITDAINMALQAVLFFYIGKIVDPAALPTLRRRRRSATSSSSLVGIAISMVVGVGMFRAAAAFRNEQLMGTLEVLLMTPTTRGDDPGRLGRLRPRVRAAADRPVLPRRDPRGGRRHQHAAGSCRPS